MRKQKVYGNPPFKVLLLATPGLDGEIVSVGEKVVQKYGVVQPFSEEKSVESRLEELHKYVTLSCDMPVVLVASSYGSWLAILFAARFNEWVSKLILVGCPSLEECYDTDVDAFRESKLVSAEFQQYTYLNERLSSGDDGILCQWFRLSVKADAVEPLDVNIENFSCCSVFFFDFQDELQSYRRYGKLVAAINDLPMPIVAFQGVADPFGVEGVRMPFVERLPHFNLISLDRCGHLPWFEKDSERFFYLLNREIKKGVSIPSDNTRNVSDEE